MDGVRQIILDTNIVLDLLVFNDAATPPLRDALQAGRLQWVATAPMRDELERVLAYPQIAKRLQSLWTECGTGAAGARCAGADRGGAAQGQRDLQRPG